MPLAPTPLILLVEDDADAAFLLRRLLDKTSLEVDVKHLNDGEKALHYFEALDVQPPAQPERPLMVLLDIKMPKVNGFEVLARIRECRARHPVVIVTTSDAPSDQQRALELGADAFISKFPSVDELRALLSQFLAPRAAST